MFVLPSTPAIFVTLELLLRWPLSSESQRAIWCRLLHLIDLISEEQSLARWEPFKHTNQRLLVHIIFFLARVSETIRQFWLLCGFLQNKHKIGDFFWWLSKVEPVIGSLKYLSCTFSLCFETKAVFSRAEISVFNAFKTISMPQLFAESNLLLIIKFKLSGIIEVIIGISKDPYLSGS